LTTVLEVEDLWVKYFTLTGVVNAVSGVSFKLGRGEMLAVVGESGSGKSTLGYALLNMVPKPGRVVKGRVVLGDTDVLKLSPEELRRVRGSRISLVFQDPFTTLDSLRKIGDQFVEFLMEHGLDEASAYRTAREYTEAVGIPGRVLDSYPHQLSGGQKQRVAIAMAISLSPEVVVADEPTTALDVIVQRQIMDLIDEVKRKYKSSFILITHDLSLALERADTVMVMYGGYVMEMAGREEIAGRMLHPYTRALFESLPRLGQRTLPKSLPGNPPDLRNPPPGCVFHPRCPKATEECRRERPMLVEASRNHFVSCIHPG